MPISSIDAISPAFEHTKQQLFQPFRMGQWAKLALVGLLAGEMTTGSCGHFNTNFQLPKHPNQSSVALPAINPATLALLIALLIVVAFVFSMFLLYLHSIMRFILFDSVLTKRCELGQQWNRRQGAALKYFLWQIAFGLVTFLGLALVIGVPAIFAFAAGWPLVLVGRTLAWFGRGVRGPLRDAILAESVSGESRGKAFGFHRAGDTLGAIIGPLCAVGLLALLQRHATLRRPFVWCSS